MKTQIQADVLKSLLSEDREEIRQIKATLNKAVVFLTTASFGITAFLFGPGLPDKVRDFRLLTDITLAAFIWTIFFQLYLNLRVCRQSLKARQDLLNGLDDDRLSPVELFPTVHNVNPDIKDTDLFWLPGLASAAILIKILVLSSS